MNARKTHDFDADTVDLAEFARALGHPARIALIAHLQEAGELCCGDLVARLPLAQATVSQHLRALREARLVEVREDGPKVFYRLRMERIRRFCNAFQLTLGTHAADEADCVTPSGAH